MVCRAVTLVSPAKTAEAIEVPLGLWARIGPRNNVLDGATDPPWEGAVLVIDREFAFYEFFFSFFFKFNEFYEIRKKIRNSANHRCLTSFDVLERNVHL